jgi:hypothetical protein
VYHRGGDPAATVCCGAVEMLLGVGAGRISASLVGKGDTVATLHRLEGADHSFVAPRGATPFTHALEEQMTAALVAWLDARGL